MRLLRITAVVFFLVLSVSAFADQVTFNTSTTQGCFTTGSSCTGTSPASWNPTGSSNTATFTGIDTNNQTTSGGALTIHLGTFNWDGNADGWGSSVNFFATVTFTLPSGINGGQSETFSADITGTVDSGDPDTLLFNFNHNSGSPLTLTFSSGGTTGSFQLYVDDLTLVSPCDSPDCSTGNVTWNGHIVNASQTTGGQVPEPGSMVLLGSGLLSLAGALRRKLR